MVRHSFSFVFPYFSPLPVLVLAFLPNIPFPLLPRALLAPFPYLPLHSFRPAIRPFIRPIDIADMRKHINYGGGYHDSQPYIEARTLSARNPPHCYHTTRHDTRWSTENTSSSSSPFVTGLLGHSVCDDSGGAGGVAALHHLLPPPATTRVRTAQPAHLCPGRAFRSSI
jgi:hypothetical protein